MMNASKTDIKNSVSESVRNCKVASSACYYAVRFFSYCFFYFYFYGKMKPQGMLLNASP